MRGWNLKNRELIGQRLESVILEAFPNLKNSVINSVIDSVNVISGFLQDEGLWKGLARLCRDLVPISQAFQQDVILGQP